MFFVRYKYTQSPLWEQSCPQPLAGCRWVIVLIVLTIGSLCLEASEPSVYLNLTSPGSAVNKCKSLQSSVWPTAAQLVWLLWKFMLWGLHARGFTLTSICQSIGASNMRPPDGQKFSSVRDCWVIAFLQTTDTKLHFEVNYRPIGLLYDCRFCEPFMMCIKGCWAQTLLPATGCLLLTDASRTDDCLLV